MNPWLINDHGARIVARVEQDARSEALIAAYQERPGDSADAPRYEVVGDVAVIPLRGVMLADVPWYYEACGVQATSTHVLASAVADAGRDPAVAAIVLDVDSPGGAATGVAEAGAMVAQAARQKPVVALVSGWCCSAAYWVASQASTVVADPEAIVGSIGVYIAIEDISDLAEAVGVRIVHLRSGPNKGLPYPGLPVTDDQTRPYQQIVDDLAERFVGAVADGRGLSPDLAAVLATGESWTAPRAQSLSLVDDIAYPLTYIETLVNRSDAMPNLLSRMLGKSAEAPAAESAPTAEDGAAYEQDEAAPAPAASGAGQPPVDPPADPSAAAPKGGSDDDGGAPEATAQPPAVTVTREQYEAVASVLGPEAAAKCLLGGENPLAVAGEEIARLRAENDQLRARLDARGGLGEDEPATAQDDDPAAARAAAFEAELTRKGERAHVAKFASFLASRGAATNAK